MAAPAHRRGISWGDSDGGHSKLGSMKAPPLKEKPTTVRLSVDGVDFRLSPSAASYGLSIEDYQDELRVRLDKFSGYLCITKNGIAIQPREGLKYLREKQPIGSEEISTMDVVDPEVSETEAANPTDEPKEQREMEMIGSGDTSSNSKSDLGTLNKAATDSSAKSRPQHNGEQMDTGIISEKLVEAVESSTEIAAGETRQSQGTVSSIFSAENSASLERLSSGAGGKRHCYIETSPNSQISFISDEFSKPEAESQRTRKLKMIQNAKTYRRCKSRPIRGMKAKFSAGTPLPVENAEFTIGSDDSSDEFSVGELSFEPETPLHSVCAQQRLTFEQLLSVLESDPSAASSVNSAGQLPLHVLSENVDLLQRKKGREIAHDFALELMEAYPEGILMKDEQDHMPFTGLIDQWVDNVYRRVTTSAARNTPDGKRDVAVDSDHASMVETFPFVDMSPVVEWSFTMLSASLNHIKTKQHQAKRRSARIYSSREGLVVRTYREEQEEVLSLRADLTENVASIPLLLKALLLIDDDEVRHRAFHLPIVRRMLLCNASVGPWLCSMLGQREEVSTRGVDYLVGISEITIQEFIGRNRSPRPECIIAYQGARRKVISALENLKGLIPTLVVLPKDEIERASSTEVVWKILNSALHQPFVIGIFLVDFALNLTMILAFRFDVKVDEHQVLGHLNEAYLNGTIQAICAYFFIRGIMDAVALAKVSRQVLLSHLSNIWKIIDTAAVVLSFFSSFLEQDHEIPGLLSAAVGLLWLKTLSFLKSVNLHLATFILALVEIVKDIRWFLVILGIVVLMFADMLHITATRTDNGMSCKTNDTSLMAPEEFCGSSLLESYVKLYSVVVGDVQYTDFSYSTGAKLLFVLFTFLCVIILLSVLIAIVSDSHTESRHKSRRLFGRARVDFTVTHLCQDKILCPSSRRLIPSGSEQGFEKWAFGRVGRAVILACYISAGLVADVLLVVLAIDIPQSLPLGTSILATAFVGALFVILTTGLVIIAHCACSGWAIHKPMNKPAIVKILKNTINKFVAFSTTLVCKKIFDTADIQETHMDKLENEGALLVETIAETERSLTRSIKASEKSIKSHIAEAIKVSGGKK